MKVSEMIDKLQRLQASIGDVDVLISDGFNGYFYRGDYYITDFDKRFIDIGIGGLLDESDDFQ